MIDRPTSTLYEVYDKRALHQGIDDLPLMHRDTNRRDAEKEARQWGACVVEITCHIITEHPMQREVIRHRVVWVHKPRPVHGPNDMNVRQLRGKLNSLGYRGRRS